MLSHVIPIMLQSRYHYCVYLTDAEIETGAMSLVQGRHWSQHPIQVCTTSKFPGCPVPKGFYLLLFNGYFSSGRREEQWISERIEMCGSLKMCMSQKNGTRIENTFENKKEKKEGKIMGICILC